MQPTSLSISFRLIPLEWTGWHGRVERGNKEEEMRKADTGFPVLRVLSVSALSLSLAGMCASVAFAVEVAQVGEPTQVDAIAAQSGEGFASWQTEPSDNPDDFLADVYGGYDDRAAAHPAEIIEYEDGTRVQRTPTPSRDSTANVRDYISWNTYRLDADNRGCQSCHDDMGELVQNIPTAAHPNIDNLGIELTVVQCMDCHETHLGGRYDSQFSGLIHGIHTGDEAFEAMGGDCWSCHYGVSTVGEEGMALWDEVKHEVLRGIETISSDALEGEFTYDQDYVQTGDEQWSYDYMRGRTEQVSATRFGRTHLGLEPDPASDGVYDEWYITVGGEVDNPITMTLSELIEAIPSETRILQMQCANNGESGTYITNQEVTGIPISAIAEYVGARDGILSLHTASADGRTAEVDYSWIEQYGAYLVYEIGGEPLSYAAGYPVQLWVAGWVADEFNKALVDLSFTFEPYEAPVFVQGAFSAKTGEKVGQPNAGICYLREGQIIPVGEAFTFQGYAASIGHAIDAIEISFDHGATWKTFETPDNDLTRWTWWNFTWTPETEGCYCIMVRSIDDTGTATYNPSEIMVNVQAVDAPEASEVE